MTLLLLLVNRLDYLHLTSVKWPHVEWGNCPRQSCGRWRDGRLSSSSVVPPSVYFHYKVLATHRFWEVSSPIHVSSQPGTDWDHHLSWDILSVVRKCIPSLKSIKIAMSVCNGRHPLGTTWNTTVNYSGSNSTVSSLDLYRNHSKFSA